MSRIIEALEASDKMRSGRPVETSDIKAAEDALGLSFASEYREYLRAFGFASYKNHELTGICNSSRLNVVDVTQEARELYNVAPDMYVIEDTGYEGVVVLQNTQGTIFQVQPQGTPVIIYKSLAEYING